MPKSSVLHQGGGANRNFEDILGFGLRLGKILGEVEVAVRAAVVDGGKGEEGEKGDEEKEEEEGGGGKGGGGGDRRDRTAETLAPAGHRRQEEEEEEEEVWAAEGGQPRPLLLHRGSNDSLINKRLKSNQSITH